MKYKLYIIKITITLIALSFLFYKLDLNEIIITLSKFDFLRILVFSIIPIIMHIWSTFNLYLLFRATGVKINYFEFLAKNIISRSVGFFLPGKVGDFSLLYFVKDKANYGVSSSNIIIDKIITLVVIIGLSSYGLFTFLQKSESIKILIFLFTLIIGSILAITNNKIKNLIKIYILRNKAHIFTGFGKNISFLIKKNTTYLLLNFISTAILWIVLAFLIQNIFTSLGYPIDFIKVISIHLSGVLISFIPISISGLGVRETTVVYLYGVLEVPIEVSATIYFVFIFFTYLYSYIILVFGGWRVTNLLRINKE